MIINLWKHRKYIYVNALNELKFRYAGSALGIFWNVLSPLLQILIFSLVFSKIMTAKIQLMGSSGNYAVYLCAGLFPWLCFSEVIQRGANAFLENATYLKKLSIPEQIFVAKSALSATFGLLIAVTLLTLVTTILGLKPSRTWVALIPILILFQGFGFGLGLILSSINVFIRDIGQALPIVLQFWMWCTPIVYVKEILPDTFQSIVVYNPAYPFIEAVHRCFVYGEWPLGWHWWNAFAWAFITPIIGYLVLRKLRPEIRDVL